MGLGLGFGLGLGLKAQVSAPASEIEAGPGFSLAAATRATLAEEAHASPMASGGTVGGAAYGTKGGGARSAVCGASCSSGVERPSRCRRSAWWRASLGIAAVGTLLQEDGRLAVVLGHASLYSALMQCAEALRWSGSAHLIPRFGDRLI